MGQVLHSSATTTHIVRAAIQRLQASLQGRRSVWRALTSGLGRVSRVSPVQTALRNCMRDEGGPFGFGDQELIPSYRKLLWSKAMVVSVAEKSGR